MEETVKGGSAEVNIAINDRLKRDVSFLLCNPLITRLDLGRD
jgi:hypothetical protein